MLATHLLIGFGLAERSISDADVARHALIDNGQDDVPVPMLEPVVEVGPFRWRAERRRREQQIELGQRRDRCGTRRDDADAKVGRSASGLSKLRMRLKYVVGDAKLVSRRMGNRGRRMRVMVRDQGEPSIYVGYRVSFGGASRIRVLP